MKILQGLLGGSLAYSSCEDKYCGENAVCREDRSRDWFFMSEATCQCMEGYMSIETLPTGALTCVDINECDLNMCHSTQDCVNLEGGYQCTCKEGFVENRNLLTFEYAPCKSLQPHTGIEIRRRRQTDGGSGDGPEVVEVVEVVVTATLGTDVEWSEELNDKESDEFKDAAADVEANLAAILNDEGTTVECTGFQQSSSRRKRRAAGDTEAIVDITVQQEQEDTGDGAPAPDLAAIEEQVKDSVVASIQESDSFTVDESSITTTSKETTVTVYDGECSKIFEENPEVFDGPGTFKRKGPNWDNYFSFNKNSDSVGWAIPEDTKFQYNCKPKKWNPSQDIAFMCNSEDKIVLCEDEDCENPTDEELDIENAMWNCGEEDDETEGMCKNIFDSFDHVFEESNHWKWYMDGWNKWWKVELEDLQQSSGFKVGTYFSHRCNNDPNLKWRKKDISFKCTRFGDKVGFYQCEDRKCDEVLNRRIKPKAMSWRFTCED